MLNKKIKEILSLCKTTTRNLLLDRNDTYCHFLWDSVFIDYNGNIYNCCHKKPGIIGNIYERDLLTVWEKGLKLKMFRLMSLNRCLECFNNCNLTPAIGDKGSIMHDRVSIKYPSTITILYGLLCNLKCSMCWQDHHNNIMLENEILKKNIDWSRVENIEFQGGEVLAMKGAKKMYLWLTKEMDKKINLITNGILINDEWAEHLVYGSRKIRISVNAATKRTHELINKGSNYERVIENIKKLIYLKQRYNSDISIQYKFTIVPENISEIADAIEVADRLGCDKINYGYDNSVPSIIKRNTELREHLKDRINQLIGSNLKIEIERYRLKKLGLL